MKLTKSLTPRETDQRRHTNKLTAIVFMTMEFSVTFVSTAFFFSFSIFL